LYLALVLPISKRHHHEDKVFFGEQGVNVKRLSPKIVHTKLLSGICYLLNLQMVFKILLDNQLAAGLKKLQLTERKTS